MRRSGVELSWVAVDVTLDVGQEDLRSAWQPQDAPEKPQSLDRCWTVVLGYGTNCSTYIQVSLLSDTSHKNTSLRWHHDDFVVTNRQLELPRWSSASASDPSAYVEDSAQSGVFSALANI